jgi:DNA-binding transcriptional LysR family regulator
MLDLYKLHIFSVVGQEGSFSAAAERLYMTQSAVSQHIKALEGGLGRQLFQRGWRGVRLTPHGEVLSRYTTEILALIAQAETALMDVDQLLNGRLSIGVTQGIGVYLAPAWVQGFRARYPALTVALQTGVTAQIVADVLSQRLDAGFIEGELNDHAPSRLSALVLEKVEQQVVVGNKHPLWGAVALPLPALRSHQLIVRESNSQSRTWLMQTLRQHGIDPVIGAEFDNLESMKRAVSLGTCVAVLPAYVVQTEVERGQLCAIPIEGKPLTRSLKLIWDSTTPFSPITRAFLASLSQRYQPLVALIEPT